MRGYIDRILAVYPFEEQVHEKLGGPPCVYVGHPLVERAGDLRPTAEEACRRGADPAIVLLLPGSRPRELRHLIEPFGDAVELVASRAGAIQLILPTVPSLTESLKEVTAGWATIWTFYVAKRSGQTIWKIGLIAC
jgi:lipid-A-disaccharide synthase